MTLKQASAEAPTPLRGGRTAPICSLRFFVPSDRDDEGKINVENTTTRKICCDVSDVNVFSLKNIVNTQDDGSPKKKRTLFFLET